MNSIALNIPLLDAEGFKKLVKANENLQFELASTGEVIIMLLRYLFLATGSRGYTSKTYLCPIGHVSRT